MINKTSIERLSNSLKATIEVWAEENGLERTGKFNIVFDEHSFRVSSSLEFVEASAKEDVAAKSYKDGLYALNLKRYSNGLDEVPFHIYSTRILHDGEIWITKEVRTRSPKFPFILENALTGKMIKATPALVIAALERGK